MSTAAESPGGLLGGGREGGRGRRRCRHDELLLLDEAKQWQVHGVGRWHTIAFHLFLLLGREDGYSRVCQRDVHTWMDSPRTVPPKPQQLLFLYQPTHQIVHTLGKGAVEKGGGRRRRRRRRRSEVAIAHLRSGLLARRHHKNQRNKEYGVIRMKAD